MSSILWPLNVVFVADAKHTVDEMHNIKKAAFDCLLPSGARDSHPSKCQHFKNVYMDRDLWMNAKRRKKIWFQEFHSCANGPLVTADVM